MSFEKEIELVSHYFKTWDNNQVQVALRNVLGNVDTLKIEIFFNELLYTEGRSKRGSHVSLVPYAVLIRIFKYLDVVSLISATCVNKEWRSVGNDSMLWERLWRAQKWNPSPSDKELMQKKKWKLLCLKSLKIEKNWVQGEYFVDSLNGHRDSVTCLQFDNEIIVSGSDDSDIIVWDANSREIITRLRDHGHMLTCLKLTKNKLISGSWDGTCKIWKRFPGGRFQYDRTLSDPTINSGVLCIAYNNGKYLLTGSFDNTIRIFDLSTGQCRRTLRGHRNSILALQFNKKIIISGSEDHTIKIWDVRTFQCTKTLTGHTNSVTSLQFCDDDNILVSGSCDKSAIVWDLITGAIKKTLQGNKGAIHCLQFNNGKLVTGSGNDTLKVWDIKSGRCLHTLVEHDSFINCLQFDHRYLVSGSGDGSVKIMDFGDPHDENEIPEINIGARMNRAKSLPGPFSLALIVDQS